MELPEHRACRQPNGYPMIARSDEELIRYEVGCALVQSGIPDADEDDPNAPDLFEWHECFEQPNCQFLKGQGCPCSGVPYVSRELWATLAPVVAKITARVEARVRAQVAEEIARNLDEIAASCRESMISTPPEYAQESYRHRVRSTAFARAAEVARSHAGRSVSTEDRTDA